MSKRFSRRTLIRSTAAGAALAFLHNVPRNVLGANEKLNIACVGTAGQAGSDRSQMTSENIVALCDVDEQSLGKAAQQHPNAKKFRDYRKMLEEAGKEFEAVLVGTPDHHHAPATVRALRMGKHVYCEKPLTHTVREARIIAETAKKAGVVTQMGTQIHATGNYRRVVELIQSGAIGNVTAVHTWVGTQYSGEENPAKPPVPKHLDWDLWLGAAPFRDYHAGLHPFSWRGYWDFGGGGLSDMACHHMDLPFWALGLTAPTKIEVEGPPVHEKRAPQWLVVKYQFPAREAAKANHFGFLKPEHDKNPGGPAVELTWYNGAKQPALLKELNIQWGGGNLFVGDKGYLICDYGRLQLLPADKFKDFKAPEKYIPDSVGGHYREWIDACKNKGTTCCDFQYASKLTEAINMGNVAYRSGKTIGWDSQNFKVTNEPAAAAQFIDKEYRKGWEVAEGIA